MDKLVLMTGKLKYADGIIIDYFENFSIKSKKTYVKGILKAKPFTTIGNIMIIAKNGYHKIENYKNGKLHGLLTVDNQSDETVYTLIANTKWCIKW